MSQQKYILNLLNKTRISGCKPSNTPIEVNAKLGEVKDGFQLTQVDIKG